MKEVQKVWAQLSKNKRQGTKLSKTKRNVKLSVVSELENLYDQLEEQTSLASYFAYEYIPEMDDKVRDAISGLDDYLVNTPMSYLTETAKEVSGLLEKLKKNADDLGIDVDDIYPDYEEMKSWADNAQDLMYDARNELETSLMKDLTAFANQLR
jgi:ElaB/YqjD/DUF883 family membrane-anchored ribosome-binding protein